MTRKKYLGVTKTIPTIIFLSIILLLPNFLTGKDNQKKILWGHNLTKKSLGKSVTSENVGKLSIEFLTSAKEFTELNTNNIKLKNSNHNMGNWYLIFEQVHQGIPVNGGHIGMVVKENGEILLTSSEFYDDINVQVIPKITIESAKEIASANFGYTGLTQIVSSSLAILPNKEINGLEFHLCWKIELFAKEPAEGATIYIDAYDGSIIKRINTVRKSVSGTVNGWIWPENYLSTWSSGNVQDSVLNVFEHETVELVGTAYEDITDDDGDYFIVQGSQGDDIYSSLVGPYVEVHNSQSGVSTDEYQSDSDYSWTWDDMSNHCDEYNVFYHVNLIYNYYYDNFGYEWNSGSQMNAYTYVNSIHAYYSSGTQSIYFGINKYNSYDPYQRFYARTSDVIYHEYSHAVKDDINANNSSAIDEGFSDYFACTIVGESLYGEGYHSGRQLKDNQYFYYYPEDITGSSHNNGTIIAGGGLGFKGFSRILSC